MPAHPPIASLVTLDAGSGTAPAWVHLLPLGAFEALGHGRYTVADAAAVIAASRLPLAIDEAHATDFAAPQGRPAPARGWIVELSARDDGIWGRVEWTPAGEQLVRERAYRQMSAVIRAGQDKRVTRILRAALTNNPAVPELTAFEEKHMDFLDQLRQALGLAEDADETAALAAVTALAAKPKPKPKPTPEAEAGGEQAAALQAALDAVAQVAGLKPGAAPQAVLDAVTALADPTQSPTVAAMQASLMALSAKLDALEQQQARAGSETIIDRAIAEKRAGINAANREQMIALHAAKPAEIEAWIAGLPQLGPSGASAQPPKTKDGKVALSAGDEAVAKVLGIKPEDMRKMRAADIANDEEVA